MKIMDLLKLKQPMEFRDQVARGRYAAWLEARGWTEIDLNDISLRRAGSGCWTYRCGLDFDPENPHALACYDKMGWTTLRAVLYEAEATAASVLHRLGFLVVESWGRYHVFPRSSERALDRALSRHFGSCFGVKGRIKLLTAVKREIAHGNEHLFTRALAEPLPQLDRKPCKHEE